MRRTRRCTRDNHEPEPLFFQTIIRGAAVGRDARCQCVFVNDHCLNLDRSRRKDWAFLQNSGAYTKPFVRPLAQVLTGAVQLSCTGDQMNKLLNAALPLAALLYMVPASAWNLVNSINADARQMPGGGTTTVVASGTAGAYNDGNSNHYPGNARCSSSANCRFGPVSYSLLKNGQRTIAPMGCSTWGNNCWITNDTNVAITSGITWHQAITAWQAKFGSSISRTHAYVYSIDTSWTTQICAAWAVYNAGTSINPVVVPGTDSCALPPIPANRCDVYGGDVSLDHGVLKVGEINGSRQEVTRQVNCTRTASVRYRVSVGTPVDLGNGISSAITVNGAPAGQMISLPGGTSTLRIASTLTDRGARTGAFSKTVVLIQSFM